MEKLKLEKIQGARKFFYILSAGGFSLLESLFLTFYAEFLLPASEKISPDGGLIQFIPEGTFLFVFTTMGLIMLFGRLVDAVADPAIAYMSDRSKSPFGRRKIFLLVGGLPLAIFAALIFFPPVPEVSIVNAFYLAIVAAGFFFFYTVYVAPYIALIPELGHTEKERLGLTTGQAVSSLVGGIIAMIGGGILIGIISEATGSLLAGYQYMAVIVSAIAVIFLYTAVFAVDEKRFSNATPSDFNFIESLKHTLKNKAFIIFMAANMCFWFIFTTLRASALPVATRILKLGESSSMNLFIALFGVAAVFFFIINKLTDRLGKKKTIALGLGIFGIFSILLSLTGILPFSAELWSIMCFAFMGIGVAVFLVVPNVVISELCDNDYKKTGQRREAMYFGIHGFFTKMILGAVTAIQAFFFLTFGKDQANPMGVRLTIAFCALVAVIGIILILKYPEEKLKEENK